MILEKLRNHVVFEGFLRYVNSIYTTNPDIDFLLQHFHFVKVVIPQDNSEKQQLTNKLMCHY